MRTQSFSETFEQLTPEDRLKVEGAAEFLLWHERKRLLCDDNSEPTSEESGHEPQPNNR